MNPEEKKIRAEIHEMKSYHGEKPPATAAIIATWVFLAFGAIISFICLIGITRLAWHVVFG